MSNDDQRVRDARVAEREIRLAASMRPTRRARNKSKYTRKRKHADAETTKKRDACTTR